MHILVVHQFFLGSGEGGGSRFNEMTRFWRTRGHAVTIVAGTVHYQTGRKSAHHRGRWIVDEETETGVRVRRAYASPSYNRSFLGRLWSYLSFMFSASHAGITASRPDIVVATSPPLFAGICGWLIARRWRVPFVFEVRDLWPEAAIETGVLTHPALIRLSYALERFLYSQADRVNVLTPAFRRVLVDCKGVPQHKVWLIPNGADLRTFRPGPKQNWFRERYDLGGRFVVAYLGAHGVANRLEQVIEAATILRERPEIAFVFVGDGMRRPALDQMARDRRLANVVFVGSVPKEQAADVCNAADACAAVLMRTDTFKTVYPNKVFDYMACARPILLAIDGAARQLVDEAGAGICVDPEDARAFADAVLRLHADRSAAEQMGRRGRAYVETHFAREALAARYLEAMEELCGDRDSAAHRRDRELAASQ